MKYLDRRDTTQIFQPKVGDLLIKYFENEIDDVILCVRIKEGYSWWQWADGKVFKYEDGYKFGYRETYIRFELKK